MQKMMQLLDHRNKIYEINYLLIALLQNFLIRQIETFKYCEIKN